MYIYIICVYGYVHNLHNILDINIVAFTFLGYARTQHKCIATKNASRFSSKVTIWQIGWLNGELHEDSTVRLIHILQGGAPVR